MYLHSYVHTNCKLDCPVQEYGCSCGPCVDCIRAFFINFNNYMYVRR